MKKLSYLFALSTVFILLLPLMFTSAQQGSDLPEPVDIAIRAIEASTYNEISLSDAIESYTFEEVNTNFNVDCMGAFTHYGGLQLHYIVDIQAKLPDGSLAIYRVRVSSQPLRAPLGRDLYVDSRGDGTYFAAADGRIALICRDEIFPPTATPTIDFTKTTATPTFTMTPTFTPSLTFTPSNTPTATLTRTPSNTPTSTFTFTPSRTPTPTYTYTPSVTPRPDSITCDGFLTSRLLPGEQGRVVEGDVPNRLRDEPSRTGNQIASMQPGSVFDVLEGPVCDPAGLAWFRVRYSRFIGWTIEGIDDEYSTEPIIVEGATLIPSLTPSPTRDGSATDVPIDTAITCPGFMPSRLVIGEQGRVTPGDPNNVRDMPSAEGALIGKIPGSEVFTVLAGPECDPAGRAWWEVDYNGLIGWTVEGQGDTYFVEPVQ